MYYELLPWYVMLVWSLSLYSIMTQLPLKMLLIPKLVLITPKKVTQCGSKSFHTHVYIYYKINSIEKVLNTRLNIYQNSSDERENCDNNDEDEIYGQPTVEALTQPDLK